MMVYDDPARGFRFHIPRFAPIPLSKYEQIERERAIRQRAAYRRGALHGALAVSVALALALWSRKP